ncbi:hypothetical protein BDK51DRAFT_33968, partial [Blyttiomyces helicus]
MPAAAPLLLAGSALTLGAALYINHRNSDNSLYDSDHPTHAGAAVVSAGGGQPATIRTYPVSRRFVDEQSGIEEIMRGTYVPLAFGLMLPIATFLNIQSLTVPGWLYHTMPNLIARRPPGNEKYVYYRPVPVRILAFISLLFGVIAVGALFMRMLEKKIKWATRTIVLASFGQALFCFASFGTFVFMCKQGEITGTYTEGLFFALICGCLSL